MDISRAFKSLIVAIQVCVLLTGVCLSLPAIRVLEPEFEAVSSRITHKPGDKARLFCSVRHLGERTVVWRRLPDKNPLTIGMTTWIEDPRIYVEHKGGSSHWDLIIEDVTSHDAGEYECQVSISQKMLRRVMELHITENPSAQVKRNPEIVISGSQFVTSGEDINLYCNASLLGNARRVLIWLKDAQEVFHDETRVWLSYVDSVTKDEVSSNLKISNSRPDDSGLYTCRSRDKKLMTSAQVNVLTGGSNNVKRAGSSPSSQESRAVLSVHCAISHTTFIFVILLLHHLLT